MPWSPEQVKTAQAVKHGWQPKGSAKGFTKKFADQVVREGVSGDNQKKALTSARQR